MSPNAAVALALALELPARGSRTLARDVHRQLRAAIIAGRIQPGLRLPSTRALAASLGVSRTTLVAVYDLLQSEGYVRTNGRGGTVVAASLSQRPEPADRPTRKSARDPRLVAHRPTAASPITTGVPPDCRFDFSVGIPDAASFPFAVWRRLAARALRAHAKARFGYGEPEGRPALRSAIAAHLSFTRAIACTAEDIVVTAGAQQAFDLLARILATSGETTVAIEAPGYPPLQRSLAAASARLAPVAVDGDGLRVDRLPACTRVVCVTPSHQFPLGVRLSLERRTALLRFARERGAVVIEDDYDGEFGEGRPLDALQTLDRDGTVFYVGTFSKSLFPALRLGFVVAPPWARPALVAAKQLADWHAPTLPQDTLAAFIAEGHLARHVRRMRRLYGERRELLQGALRRFCGARLDVVGIGAGLHLAARLDGAIPVARAIERARRAGIWLDAVPQAGPAASTLVFGYGAIDGRDISEAVRRLSALLR
jgi:GntR family transcriptional regulator/MocR family aminotransferase